MPPLGQTQIRHHHFYLIITLKHPRHLTAMPARLLLPQPDLVVPTCSLGRSRSFGFSEQPFSITLLQTPMAYPQMGFPLPLIPRIWRPVTRV